MKDLFKGYYELSEEEFQHLWRDAIFIFDTNVLLNLYRYQSTTRDALLKVMETLGERVWIPHHVGLEFQRNRLTVIADQHKKFAKVEGIVNSSISSMKNDLDSLQLKKRHSHINPDKLIEEMTTIQSEFCKTLEGLKTEALNVRSDDVIRDRLDILFKERVGSPPSDQAMIDEYSKEGEERYKKGIPPGFEDAGKDKGNDAPFNFAGISYKRKYGDLIVWKQIISHAKDTNQKNIIFVTDDKKPDWWWKVSEQTIGVLPALVDEICEKGKVDRFHAYNTENFLEYAKKQLGMEITNETIDEVRQVADIRYENALAERGIFGQGFRPHKAVRNLRGAIPDPHLHGHRELERAVHQWLWSHYPDLKNNPEGFPDFVWLENGHKVGIEIIGVYNSSFRLIEKRIVQSLHHSRDLLLHGVFNRIELLIIVSDTSQTEKLMHQFKRMLHNFHEMPIAGELQLKIVSALDYGLDETPVSFEVLAELPIGDIMF